jgi:hypothetical protein
VQPRQRQHQSARDWAERLTPHHPQPYRRGLDRGKKCRLQLTPDMHCAQHLTSSSSSRQPQRWRWQWAVQRRPPHHHTTEGPESQESVVCSDLRALPRTSSGPAHCYRHSTTPPVSRDLPQASVTLLLSLP